MKIRRDLAASTLSLLSIATLFVCADARAGGFALNEMSAAGVGNAHAGGAAAAEDIGTIFYNPAGLMRMSGRQFMVVGSAIDLSAKFQNNGSFTSSGALTGGNGGDAGSVAFVPALYYAMDLAPNMRFGIGLQTPFGLKTEYDGNWAGRYQALKSELKSININPTIAYKVNDQLSLGAGVSAQYIDVELSRAIDFGSICAGTPALAATCVASGFVPQARDGSVTVEGDDWGFGFNLGALYTLNERIRLGIAYRSKITHKLSGDARFTRPAGLPAPLAASPTFSDTGARASVDLPESLSVSGYMDIDPKWSVMGDVTWMRWSRFEELRINFDNGAPASVTPEEFRNTVRVAVAVNYRYNDQWKLRGGIAWDESPVRDEFRTPRIPDNDRTWLAFGAQFKPSRQGTWDFGYAHLFVKDSSINKAEPPVGGTLVGDYDSSVNILSVQYRHEF